MAYSAKAAGMAYKATARRIVGRIGRGRARKTALKAAGVTAAALGLKAGSEVGLFKLGQYRGRRRKKGITGGRRYARHAFLPGAYNAGYETGLAKRG